LEEHALRILSSNYVLISNFCLVLNVVFFLLGESPTSEFYVLTFQNTLSVHRWCLTSTHEIQMLRIIQKKEYK
jgi:hypothetical protein